MRFCVTQAYPEGHPEAAIGKALHEMHVGDKIEVKGPYGSFKYQPGKYKAIGAFTARIPNLVPPALTSKCMCVCLSASTQFA